MHQHRCRLWGSMVYSQPTKTARSHLFRSPVPLTSAVDKGLNFACSSPLLSNPPSYSSSSPPPAPPLFLLQHRALSLHSADCVSKRQVWFLPDFPLLPQVKLQRGQGLCLLCKSLYPHPFQSAWHIILPGNIYSPTGCQDVDISSEVTVSRLVPLDHVLGIPIATPSSVPGRRERSPAWLRPRRWRRLTWRAPARAVSGSRRRGLRRCYLRCYCRLRGTLRVERLRRAGVGPGFRPLCRMEIIRSSACPPCTSPSPTAPLTRPARPRPGPVCLAGPGTEAAPQGFASP